MQLQSSPQHGTRSYEIANTRYEIKSRSIVSQYQNRELAKKDSFRRNIFLNRELPNKDPYRRNILAFMLYLVPGLLVFNGTFRIRKESPAEGISNPDQHRAVTVALGF